MTLVPRLLRLVFLSLLLSACGGGGGGGGANAPTPPTANAGADQTLEYGGTVTLDASGSSSPRSATLSYTWSLANKPAGSTAALSSTTVASPSFVADVPGAYEADLVVNDGTASSSHDRVVVTATNPNPVANATTQHNVLIGTSVTLDGSASLPPTGGAASALGYQWTLTSKPAGSLAAIAGPLNPTASVFADVVGTYTVTLVVTYQDKVTAPLLVTITASQSNTAPIADAGGPYTIERGQTLTLDGTGSSDADGDTLSYRWYLMSPSVSGAAAIWMPNGSALRLENALQGYTTATPTITPDVVSVSGWTVYLAVYDGTTLSDLSSATITVTKPASAPNTPPVASFYGTPRVNFFSPAYSDEVELGTVVFSSGNSWDIDGTSISGTGRRRYEWISTPPGFTRNDLSTASSFSFTPTVAGDYTVEMIGNDGEADSAPVQRTFTARTGANRAPVPGITVDSSTILVGDTGWFDARSSEDANGDRLTYNWTLFDKPDGSTATLKFENVTLEDGTVLTNARAGVVADRPGVYLVLLSVTDSHGVTSSPVTAHTGRVIAKARNNAPNIERISNNNEWLAIRRGNTHFNDSDQPYVIGGEPVTIAAFNAIDPDLDTLYYLWTLQQPAGSALTDADTRATFTPGVPVVPGTYTVTGIVSDGIARAEPKTLRFNVVERANHPSLLLEDYHSAYPPNFWDRAIVSGDVAPGYQPWYPGAMPRARAFPYWDHADGSHPVFQVTLDQAGGDVVVKNYRLTAFGGDYTVSNLNVGRPILPGADVFSGKFVGLTNGQVIRKGESVDLSLVVTVPANISDYVDAGNIGSEPDPVNGMANLVRGMTFTFEIAEHAGWTFEYQPCFN